MLCKKLVHLAINGHQQNFQVDRLLVEENFIGLRGHGAAVDFFKFSPHFNKCGVKLLNILLHDFELHVSAFELLRALEVELLIHNVIILLMVGQLRFEFDYQLRC